MNHHEALTALRNTTSCEVLNSSLSRILQGAASPRTGEERRGQRLPSWERRSAVSQRRRGRCLQSPSFQGRLLTLTPSTCACTHTHTHTHTTSLPTGARTGPGGTSPKRRGPSSPRGSCLEVPLHNLEARPVPDGGGDPWTDEGSLHQVTVSGLLPLTQIITRESLSSPPPRQPRPWSADSRGPTLARAAPNSAGFPVCPGVYCHQRVGVRIVANGASTPCPPSSGALVHTGQWLTPGSRVSHHLLILATLPLGSCSRCQHGWSTPCQSVLLSV